MKKSMMMAFVAMGMPCVLFAQSLKIAGTLQGDVPADLKLYVMPVSEAWAQPDSVTQEGKKFQVVTTSSPYGIYKLVGVANRRQVIIPFHVEGKQGDAALSLALTSQGDIQIQKADVDTKALTAFNDLSTAHNKQLWMEGKEMEPASLKNLLLGGVASADSLIQKLKPSAITAQYLRLWASTGAFEGLESLKFATGRTAESLGIDVKSEVGKWSGMIDCPMASTFDSAPRLVLATLPKGSLEERIAHVESRVKAAALKNRIEAVLLDQYISSFDYAHQYEKGLAELTALTQRFQLDEKYLGNFKMRKASIAGTPFPAGVNLYDLKGNKVDFSKYRGKYVYVDMWASWCIPCIKEIPHLKALEKDLQNKDVTFLSISIDNKEEAWKKKVAALGLEGELLINKDNKLGESLNVSGIPFFLIYDKEGKLYMYNAYRPSDVRLKPLLEGLK